jgi:hypothetical protein
MKVASSKYDKFWDYVPVRPGRVLTVTIIQGRLFAIHTKLLVLLKQFGLKL